MSLFLVISAGACLISNSWLSIWILLEINTLSFCALLQTNQNNESQNNSEILINYLIIQSIASAILVLSALYANHTKVLLIFTLAPLLALIINAAAVPLHQWFIEISNNLSWGLATILFTWQKLAPLYLLVYQLKAGILFFTVFSAWGGALMIINNNLLNEIMAWSSVFNLSWILFSLTVSTNVFLIFLVLYWASVLIVVYVFAKTNSNILEELTTSTNNWISLFVMMNLAGLPPFVGFLANWLSFTEGLNIGIQTVTTLLLVTSTINLYVYLRIITNNAVNTAHPSQNFTNPISNNLTLSFIFINGVALISISI